MTGGAARCWLTLVACATSIPASAQWTMPGTPIVPPPLPSVGSEGTVVTIDPLVPRPASKSCTIELFARREFLGDAPQPITVAPPPGCPGPWARIVIESDFDGTPGTQYDRTARIMLGGVNLFTGTTMEPRDTLAPHWHVERDITDYAALFATRQRGSAELVNFLDDRHDGRLFWQARIVFHAADAANPAPRTADIVTPLAPAVFKASAATPAIERTVTWPRNIERMAMDVLVMPQQDDEFWQLCLPASAVPVQYRDDVSCGLPFRESEVRIDGIVAGFAPVFPWIYTGGMGAWNWTVIPGVGTLNLQPYRVDLTPFAARMNDGRPHRIQLSGRFAGNYMATTATLLAWRDMGRAIVTGKLVRNDLQPSRLRTHGTVLDARAHGTTIDVTARRRGSVVGYVEGSRGRVTTRIDQTMRFELRTWDDGRDIDKAQATALDTRTVTTGPDGPRRERVVERFSLASGPAIGDRRSTRSRTGDLDQSLFRDHSVTGPQGTIRRITSQTVSPREQPADKPVIFPDAIRSTITMRVMDSRAGCYDRVVTAFKRRLVMVEDRCAVYVGR